MSKLKQGAKLLWGVTKATTKGVGAAVNGARQLVVTNEEDIARGARAAVGGLGSAVRVTGNLIAKGAGSASTYLHNQAATSDNKALKLTGHLAGYTATAVEIVGNSTSKVGQLTGRAAPAVGGAAGGALRGAVEAVSGVVDMVAVSEADLDQLRRELRHYGEKARQRSDHRIAAIAAAQKGRRKVELLDLLVVGGITLSEAIRSPAAIPADVLQAYRLAYPNLAAGESFSEAVARMSPDQLVGFANGVKGKLFEVELVEHMNAGNLPNGWSAEMAQSANQSGWDIRVLDSEGRVSEVLQAKATESADYVKDALVRYPDVDVTTTSEVHAQLVALGMAESVRNSGISEAALDAKITSAAHAAGNGFDASDLVPSAVGLAVIAMSAFMDKSLSLEQRGAEVGNRGARVAFASGAGKLALVVTQTWWLGLMAGVGSGWLATGGRGKRERYEALKGMVATMRRTESAQAPALRYVSPPRLTR